MAVRNLKDEKVQVRFSEGIGRVMSGDMGSNYWYQEHELLNK